MPAPRRRAPSAWTPITLAAVGVVLVACSSAPLPEPFIDMRREAGQLYTVGSSTLDRPAVCYNTMNATADEVQALADAVCAETGRVAVYESSDVAHCTVLQPHRSFFTCAPPGSSAAATGRISTVQPGPLGVRLPGAGTPSASGPPDDGLDIPELPPAPERPPEPGTGSMFNIFD